MKKSRARRINSAPLPCITSSFTPREEENEKNFFFFFFFFCFLLFFFFFVETKHKNSKKTNFFFVFFQKEKKRNNSVCTKKRRGGNTTHISSILSRHHLYARVHLRPRERSRRQRGDRALVVAPPSSRVVKRKVFLFFWR